MSREEWDVVLGREDEELEDRRGPRRPDARRGETERGGGGRDMGEEDSGGTSGRGEEEREPGWEKAWSLGGI